MKKVFRCLSPNGSPNNRNRNRNTTAVDGNTPLAHVNTRSPIADGTTSARSSTTVPSSAPTLITDLARSLTHFLASASASTSASTSTNMGKSEEKDDSAPAPTFPATLERINELTAEMATLNLNLGPVRIQKFSLIQLQSATAGFSPHNYVGRGGFGCVYRGNLAPQNQEVAIKCLDLKSKQGSPEFVTEVELLSNTEHENIVQLIGYCAENEHRMLVYEYIKMGTLEDHLLNHAQEFHLGILDWETRVRIAYEIAKGVDYLHRMEPKRIYRDLKCANILLGEGYTVKLSDFGCVKKAPPNEHDLNLTRVLGTQGYLDPRYFASGNCTIKTDVYSFGVILLELVTGRKSLDVARPPEERSLVIWARRLFSERARFTELLDPLLKGKCHELTLHRLVTMAQYCIHEEPDTRPTMSQIVDALREMNEVADEPQSPRFRRLTRNPTVPSSSAARVRYRS